MRDQATILAAIEARARDSANARWTDAEIYNAINDSLLTWHGRVSIPLVHNVTGGFTSGENEYPLPDYVNPSTVVPQMKRTVPFSWWGAVSVDDSLTWTDVPGWTLEPDGDGGTMLRFDIPPFSTEGRYLWWGINGPLPTTIPTLNTSLPSTTITEIRLNGTQDVLDHGYVLIDSEWFQYAGMTHDSGMTVLANPVRAINGTTAASHTPTTAVKFGVAMPRLDLYRTLIDQTFIFLHELYLTSAASKETQTHQQMVGFYQGRVDKFWRSWTPARRPRIVIDRRLLTVE
jgi:hypothetical protein